MKKTLFMALAAGAFVAGSAAYQPADAQTRHARVHAAGHHHHLGHTYAYGYGHSFNPVALGAGAIIGAATALVTAPLVVATVPFAYSSHGYEAPYYAPAPVVYATPVVHHGPIVQHHLISHTYVTAPRRTMRVAPPAANPRVVRRAVR
jgi:hypothetical protein